VQVRPDVRWQARRSIVSVIMAGTAIWMVLGAAVSVAEDGTSAGSAAGMIVDAGSDEPIHLVVTFEGDSITALELLHAADLPVVSVNFGGLGEAVCEIASTGCDVTACRQHVCQTGDPDSPFWQYWQQDEAGNWSLSPLGVSRATIEHGDIVAWMWSGTVPELEPVAWPALVARAGAPEVLSSGAVSGEPAVYRSMDEGETANTDGPVSTLTAAGLIAAVGVVGGWLVVRNRAVVRGNE
jgi:hypothetical protein